MRLLRIVGVGLFLFVLAIGVAWFFRLPIATAAVNRVLASSGVEAPKSRVTALSPNRIVIEDLSDGPTAQGLAAKRIEARYRWRALLASREVDAIDINGARIVMRVDDAGNIKAPFSVPASSGDSATALPAIRVSDSVIIFRTPDGDAEVSIGATIADGGGMAQATLASSRARFGSISISEFAGSGDIALKADGGAAARGTINGGAFVGEAAIENLALEFDGALEDWRAAARDVTSAVGRLRANVRSARLDAADAALISGLSGGAPDALAAAIRSFAAEGSVEAVFDKGAIDIALPDGAFVIATDRGDLIEVTAPQGALYAARDGERRAAATAKISGPANGDVSMTANASSGGPWRLGAEASLDRQSAFGFDMRNLRFTLDGEASANSASGEIAASALVDRGDIGRLRVSGATLEFAAPFAADFAAKTLTAGAAESDCLELGEAAFAVGAMALTGSVSDASFCARSGPLLDIAFSGDAITRATGRLVARRGSLAVGETKFAGAIPTVDLTAIYEPSLQKTSVESVFSGGDIVVNDVLRFSRGVGVLSGALVGETLSSEIRLDDAVIAFTAPEPLFAPVRGEGIARLEENKFRFDYKMKSARGLALGTGDGVHQVTTGEGASRFVARNVSLTPKGLQPDAISPFLRGVIADATGKVDAVFDVVWSKAGVGTSGEIGFDNVTFRGPTLAVSQTANINGRMRLKSLLPIATDGEQTLSIGAVDLNALKLEGGDVRFELPGDDTLRIQKAEFPWYGGAIGAYETTTKLTGGDAGTLLKASDVDLEALLKEIDIEGLSGAGKIEGDLPIVFRDGRANVDKGRLSAVGPGVIRYSTDATENLANSQGGANIAFTVLRELKFTRLEVGIDGPLDGTLNFSILIEGVGPYPVRVAGVDQVVEAPVKYTINLNAPLLALIQQARLTADVNLQRSQSDGDEKK